VHESFVVRTTVSFKLLPTNGSTPADASPYSPGYSFIFKIKHDEPYMISQGALVKGEGYMKGHGIIATRKLFLEWLETDEGKRGKRGAQTDKEGYPAAKVKSW
jgi:hypothetical protein